MGHDTLLHYQVSMSQPETHLFEVYLRINQKQLSETIPPSRLLNLKMPVWTPGSYLVREYARHLQDFQVTDQQGRNLPWGKLGKNHWQIQLDSEASEMNALRTDMLQSIHVSYRIFANDLTVRTNHLDTTHGYFNGAALFFFIPGCEHCPLQIEIVAPDSWKVATTLPQVPDQPHTFLAQDFDTLVDSPVEIGVHQCYEFEVEGKPHQWVVWGKGNLNPERVITDTEKLIAQEARIFGGLPYDRYLFLLHLSDRGFGGLEHKDSCSLNYPRFGIRAKEKYNRFLQLEAHEFFHLWNVKRIRPQALEKFDYQQENYTPSLWFCEGATSFYDGVIPFRAGLFDLATFLKNLSANITRLQSIPGRRVQPLSESSWDAWIKLYRREAHSDNNQVSYYLKGEVVAWLLDLQIRARHDNQRSLDDVMRRMWQQFGKSEIGYTPAQLQQVIESVAGISLEGFFQRYIHGTEELPYNQHLEPFGLQVKSEMDEAPYLGCRVVSEGGKEKIRFVAADSPAGQAGIDPDDELLALNGYRVTAERLLERLKDFCPGDTVELTVFHQDQLQTYSITLAQPQPKSYKLVSVEAPTPEQKRNFTGWLGCAYRSV
ncbi:MAG: M61 family metallopeptidase [Microcoleaceae cyanobacterium]